MKKYLFIAMFCFFSFLSFSQEATEILKKTYNKCQSVQNGSYELLIEAKNMTSKDTTRNMFTCVFEKLKEDSIFHLAYKRMVYSKSRKNYFPDVMYTGSDYVNFNYRDSTATIMPVNKWAEVFKSQHYGCDHKNYEPLTSIKSSPLPHDSDFMDNTYLFRLIGEEKVNDTLCSHIQVNEVQQNDRFTLVKHELNTLKDESELSLGSIPTYFKIKDYKLSALTLMINRRMIWPPSLKKEVLPIQFYWGQRMLPRIIMFPVIPACS